MSRRPWHLSLLLAAASFILASCAGGMYLKAGTSSGATSFLPDKTRSIVSLHEAWDYYPAKLLYPVDFEQSSAPKPAEQVPLTRGGPVSDVGYATYRLQIAEPPTSGYDGILIPRLASAMELWVDGEKVGEVGRVGTSLRDEMPGATGLLALFPAKAGSAEVVLQLSDFHKASVGRVPSPVLYGTAVAIAGYEAAVRGLQLALVAILALFALLFLIRYLVRRSWEELSPLLVAAVCFAGALRELTVYGLPGLALPSSLLSGLPWPYGARAGLASYFLLFLAYHLTFLDDARDRVERIAIRSFLALSLVAGVAALFVGGAASRSLAIGAGGILTLGLAAFVLRMTGLTEGRDTARAPALSLAGAIVLLLAAANSVLVFAGVSTVGYAAPLALVVFAVLAALEELRPREGSDRAAGVERRLASREVQLFTEDVARPLHGIVGLAESFLSGGMGELSDDQVVSLSLIAANGLRVSNIVEDYADAERLARGALRLERESVSIEPLFERVGEHLKPRMLVRSVEIRDELPRDLPAVNADRRRLERIIYNLLAEGIRCVEHGAIVLRGRAEGRMVEVAISADEVPRVPETEPDAAGAAGDDDGSRIGRKVAVELIRLHGGRFSEGSGAFSVAFSIPAAAGEVEEEISEQLIRLDEIKTGEADSAAGSEQGGEGRGGLRVLLAAADLVALQTMRNRLLKEQFRVQIAFDGEETLDQIGSSPPDMLVVDAALPKIDGIEVCRRVRKRYPATQLPVLILVDKERSGDLAKGLSAGASDFVTKPISPDEFQARATTHISLAKMNTVYSRFVPVELLHFLGHENVVELQLGDQIQREMTILFVDIRAFTNLSEGMTPQESFKFINSYLSRITPFIRENNGFVDKYIGDAIMALYPGSPEDAIRSAIRMVDYLQEYNGYRRNSGYRPINVGIGIHTGNLIAGIIGDSDRMQGTVISDAVNLASRVQDVTKLYGANIIISQDTFIRLENPTAYNFRFLGRVKVKGKNQTVSLFEIFDGEPPEFVALKNRTKKEFEDAILLFSQRKFLEASNSFRSIAVENPVDRAAALFLNRAEFFLRREKANWLLR